MTNKIEMVLIRSFVIGAISLLLSYSLTLLQMAKPPKNHYFEDVYDVVRSIPRGRISTYGAIADFLTLGSARMVGWALRHSSVMDGPIPAHRVVNREGYLSGRLHFPDPKYMQRALEKEGVKVKKDTVVDFEKHFWHPAENML